MGAKGAAIADKDAQARMVQPSGRSCRSLLDACFARIARHKLPCGAANVAPEPSG